MDAERSIEDSYAMTRYFNPQILAVAASVLILAIVGGRAVAGQQGAGHDPTSGVTHDLPPADLREMPSRTGKYEIINVEGPSLDLIIGADERDQVTNTTNFPNSAVALIEAWKDGEDTVFLCTASFVGPNVLLTAAHCLWIPEFGGFPDGVAIAPGDQTVTTRRSESSSQTRSGFRMAGSMSGATSTTPTGMTTGSSFSKMMV